MSARINVYSLHPSLLQRTCPKCGGLMLISDVLPYTQKGRELRIFECTRCAHYEKHIVKVE
jgi:NAD-dependent SIR2 family protein deacetylase